MSYNVHTCVNLHVLHSLPGKGVGYSLPTGFFFLTKLKKESFNRSFR